MNHHVIARYVVCGDRFDSEEPNTRLEFTPTNRPEIDPNDPLYVKTGRVPKFVSVRVTYKDGTRSALKKFYPSAAGPPKGKVDESGY